MLAGSRVLTKNCYLKIEFVALLKRYVIDKGIDILIDKKDVD